MSIHNPIVNDIRNNFALVNAGSELARQVICGCNEGFKSNKWFSPMHSYLERTPFGSRYSKEEIIGMLVKEPLKIAAFKQDIEMEIHVRQQHVDKLKELFTEFCAKL